MIWTMVALGLGGFAAGLWLGDLIGRNKAHQDNYLAGFRDATDALLADMYRALGTTPHMEGQRRAGRERTQ